MAKQFIKAEHDNQEVQVNLGCCRMSENGKIMTVEVRPVENAQGNRAPYFVSHRQLICMGPSDRAELEKTFNLEVIKAKKNEKKAKPADQRCRETVFGRR